MTINNFDTGAKNYDNRQYLSTPVKNNHIATELHDMNTPYAQVRHEFNPRQFQQSPSTPKTSLKLPPSGNHYLFFQTDGKNARAAQCEKSGALTKVIDTILSIILSDQPCVIIKLVLQS